jgi:hypothetical protein
MGIDMMMLVVVVVVVVVKEGRGGSLELQQ